MSPLRQAVSHDYVAAEYKDGYRSNRNFMKTNCLLLDCDNDFPDDAFDWVNVEDVKSAFPDVSFGIHYSRNHDKSKNGKAPRPKFHCIFPIDEMSGMPGSPNRDKQTMENTICKIIDLQAEINKDIDVLVDLKSEILSVINAVENIDYRLLLHKRYIENMSWPEIAVDLNVGMRRMYYLHDQALLCVEVPY